MVHNTIACAHLLNATELIGELWRLVRLNFEQGRLSVEGVSRLCVVIRQLSRSDVLRSGTAATAPGKPTDKRIQLAHLLPQVLLADFLNHRRGGLLWRINLTATADPDRTVTHRSKRIRTQ